MIIPAPWQLYAAAGIAVASAYSGWKVRDWQCDAAVAKAMKDAAKQERESKAHVDSASASYEALREQIDAKQFVATNTIREIYKNVEVPGNCALPVGAYGLLGQHINAANAAASGQSGAPLP